MSSHQHDAPQADASVRPARPDDAFAVAAVTIETWRRQYAAVLPAGELAGISPVALADQWRGSLEAPPSPRHRALVALRGSDVVGYVVLAPTDEPDLAASDTSEIVDLVVHPALTGVGHGSRLLAAAVDTLRSSGVPDVVVWCADGDAARRRFLESAGFEPDGATRALDSGPGTPELAQVRYAAHLG